MINIAIVDNDVVMLEWLQGVFNKSKDYEVVFATNDTREVFNNSDWDNIDVLISETALLPHSGFDVLQWVRTMSSKRIYTVLYSLEENSGAAFKAKLYGADEYAFTPTEDDEYWLSMVGNLAGGKESELANVPIKSLKFKAGNLSVTEKHILSLLSKGFTSKEIARGLQRSEKTIDTHRTNIMRKMGANNITQCVRMALINGMIQ